ncbi:MAG: glycosyltransferase family 4 protein [Lewinella sp.]|nr:glycosyltransferase family 4 protein [Lewinella sp.]
MGSLAAKIHAAGLRPGLDVVCSGPYTEAGVAALLQQSHALVMFSHYETQGIVLLEALASGRPVVATRAGGPIEIISSQTYGELVEPGDEAGLALALARVVSRYHHYDPQRLRAQAVANYGQAAVKAQLNAAYRRALLASAPPSP